VRSAAADPRNTDWQRYLSQSHERLGDVLVAQGNLDGARDAFEKTHVILERLAAADPLNANWQRDVVRSHCKVATLLREQDPYVSNSHWQRCHETLLAMKRAGMFLDQPLAQLLGQLEAALGPAR